MKYITEHEWEAQKQLINQGYKLVAPTKGCYAKKENAEEVAGKYKDAYVICHNYGGRHRGYMVFAKDE